MLNSTSARNKQKMNKIPTRPVDMPPLVVPYLVSAGVGLRTAKPGSLVRQIVIDSSLP